MSTASTAARLGIVASLAVIALVLVPYGIADGRAIAVYYGGLIGPPIVGLFVAVVAIALAGAERGRSDRPTVAGVVLVLGLLSLGLTVVWAAGVSASLVGGMTTIDLFEYHRWALAVATLGVLIAGGWYARAVV